MITKKATQTENEANGTSARPYKRLLMKIEQMRNQASKAAYDRAILLVRVFDDADFRADTGCLDDFKAAEILDDYVSDLCLSFLQLRSLLEFQPDFKAWKDGSLRQMYDGMLEGKRKKRDDKPAHRRESITLKEHQAVKKEAVRWQGRSKFLAGEVERLKERIAILERDNEQLRERLALTEELQPA